MRAGGLRRCMDCDSTSATLVMSAQQKAPMTAWLAPPPVTVAALHADRHGIGARLGLRPGDVDEALLVRRPSHVRAVGAVDGHSAAPRHVPEDLVARNRIAADAKTHEQVADTLDVHAAA